MNINRSKHFNITMAVCCLVMLSPSRLLAQYENVWAFGDNGGVDFNGATPISIETAIKTTEGSAAVCDDKGALLFYTDGHQVWDRNHKMMANGNNLPGQYTNMTFSTSQGALIVPLPAYPTQYYVFSLAMDFGLNPTGKLYYSVVDLSLNNGLGDVVPTKKGILIDSLLSEHMTAIAGPDCNIWLLVADKKATKFHAHNITIDGVQPQPKISPKMDPEGIYGGGIGCLEGSPDGKKLAMGQGNLCLYDFDIRDGSVSSPVLLSKDTLGSFYGVCFSPDNSKLYASTPGTLQQFDLSSGDPATMTRSRYQVGSGNYHPSLKRGPDQRVYAAANNAWLNLIEKPNLAGPLCSYKANGLPLLPHTKSNLGLPNVVARFPAYQSHSSKADTVYCADSFKLVPKQLDGRDYSWFDQDKTLEKTVYESGTYTVKYNRYNQSDCTEYIDSFTVVMIKNKFHTPVRNLARQCPTDTFWLSAADTTGFDHLWDDGLTGPGRMITQSGIYSVKYRQEGCNYYYETYIVTFPPENPKVAFEADSVVCMHQRVSFINTSPTYFNRFSWHFGDGDEAAIPHSSHSYDRPGKYQVMLIGSINGTCPDTIYKNIEADTQVSNSFRVEPVMICQGASIQFLTDTLHPTVKNRLWQFGDGGRDVINDGAPIHAYSESGLFTVKLTTQFRACPDHTIADTVRVFPIPIIDLGQDTTVCFHGPPLVLYNHFAGAGAVQQSQWNTGAVTDTLLVRQPGTYTLRLIQAPIGCTNKGSVTIGKSCFIDIPNAFTPNNDGLNDFFFPRQPLTKGIQTFKLQVFRQNGQLVYETRNREGRGWDGTFNGRRQEPGVYVYLVEVKYTQGTAEQFRGNVTLVR